jgi:hypothetical protein
MLLKRDREPRRLAHHDWNPAGRHTICSGATDKVMMGSEQDLDDRQLGRRAGTLRAALQQDRDVRTADRIS